MPERVGQTSQQRLKPAAGQCCRRLEAAIEEDGSHHRLQGIGQQGGLLSAGT
ncbi:MAG: hypothetical protein ABSC45_06175 [Desulfobaccales bacterium]